MVMYIMVGVSIHLIVEVALEAVLPTLTYDDLRKVSIHLIVEVPLEASWRATT